MGQIMFFFGAFFGCAVFGLFWTLVEKRAFDEKVGRKHHEFVIRFISEMARRDKYVIGPVNLGYKGELSNALILAADTDSAVSIHNTSHATVKSCHFEFFSAPKEN